MEMVQLVNEFLRLLLKGVNTSCAALFLMKTKIPTGFSKYRPIIPVHGLHKIVAKLLSSMLKTLMPSIISFHQTIFIVGILQILDGFNYNC